MRNLGIVIAILPIAFFLWIIGWSLFWIGSQNKPQETTPKRDGTEITTTIYEEYKVALDKHNTVEMIKSET